MTKRELTRLLHKILRGGAAGFLIYLYFMVAAGPLYLAAIVNIPLGYLLVAAWELILIGATAAFMIEF
jgi:hypothetical protein